MRARIHGVLARAYGAMRKGGMPTLTAHFENSVTSRDLKYYIYSTTPALPWNTTSPKM